MVRQTQAGSANRDWLWLALLVGAGICLRAAAIAGLPTCPKATSSPIRAWRST
jgi:hypothetical protein